jgi:hypothetical protein
VKLAKVLVGTKIKQIAKYGRISKGNRIGGKRYGEKKM